VYKLHALFDVLPPTAPITKSVDVSHFEHYLMGYMRIHTHMTNFAISLIWGRDNGHSGRIINKAIHSIGSAGKDLSILDITAEYLEATCPQQYKDEGLEKCCAVPDGKDFMIYTTRKNMLFTRASYSDKVHHSAVRCISWGTPMGLSFEHTDCFLGRVSEKKLVELWGPRLKKCPIGWHMLSDRGFFDTARFYPNMNHQKTPKFLQSFEYCCGNVRIEESAIVSATLKREHSFRSHRAMGQYRRRCGLHHVVLRPPAGDRTIAVGCMQYINAVVVTVGIGIVHL